MTVVINDITPLHQYVASASQTDFVFTYVIYATSDIKVYQDGVLKTEVTDYSVKKSDGSTIASSDLAEGLSGGKVVFVTAMSGGEEVSLSRDIPIARTTDYSTGGNFSATSVNVELDKIVAFTQQVERDVARTLHLHDYDTATNVTIPASRANKYVYFDANGDVSASSELTTGTATISSFAETLLDDADAATARATLGAQADLITTRGDLVYGNSSGNAARLAIGANEKVLVSNGTDVTWGNAPLPKYYIEDLTLSRTSMTELTVSSGQCRDSTNTYNLSLDSSITKTIDTYPFTYGWVAGDGNNGLPTGLSLPNPAYTFIHVFIISKTDGTTDIGFDTSQTATNLLAEASGYTLYRRIGSFVHLSDTKIMEFQQKKDLFQVKSWPTVTRTNTGFTTMASFNSSPVCSCETRLRVSARADQLRYIRFVNDMGSAGTADIDFELEVHTGPSSSETSQGATISMLSTDGTLGVEVYPSIVTGDFYVNVTGWRDLFID